MAIRNVTPVKLPFKLTPKKIIIAIIAVIVFIGATSSFFTVGQEEEAVVLLLGKLSTIVGPGLHFKIPFGLEKNYNILTKRVITQEFGYRSKKIGIESQYSENYPRESEMLTSDKNIVDVQFYIHYKIEDPAAWLINVQHLVKDDYSGRIREMTSLSEEKDLWYEKTIRDISQSIINMLIGDKDILQIIGSDRERKLIQDKAMIMINSIFKDYQMGVKVDEVALQNTLPPKGEVRDAFEDVNKADQDKERHINEGKEIYNKAVEEAKGTKNRMIEEAYGYAIERKNVANGDIARFNNVLTEYKKAPDITRERLYIEMYEAVFGKDADTDLIDRNLKNFIPFKTLENKKQGGEE
ncbi:MAG: FtsH protease activity modulator HflK [Spirochaetales bacterium]|nr:FtsH protease activity modulator HflK [Spirochaetales bacterium]